MGQTGTHYDFSGLNDLVKRSVPHHRGEASQEPFLRTEASLEVFDNIEGCIATIINV
jgi:hypothetical protein